MGRGANLDLIDTPLNNRPWLLDQFARIRALPAEKERLAAIAAILDWTNPGPGGFYDDLGNAVGATASGRRALTTRRTPIISPRP